MCRFIARAVRGALVVLIVTDVFAIDAGAAPGPPPKPPEPTRLRAPAPPPRLTRTPAANTSATRPAATRHPTDKPHLLKQLPQGSVKAEPAAEVHTLRVHADRTALGVRQTSGGSNARTRSSSLAPDGCDHTWSIARGPLTSDGFPTIHIEGQTNCTPPESIANSALTLTLTNLDFNYQEYTNGGKDCGTNPFCGDSAEVGPFDWGSTHQLDSRPTITLADGWQWTSWPEQCSVSGAILRCDFVSRLTLLQPPPAATQVSPSGTLSDIVAPAFPTYTWNAAGSGPSLASLYALQVQDALGRVLLNTWYNASDAGCAQGGTCSLTPSLAANEDQDYWWWVLPWNSGGYGPWSTGLQYRVPKQTQAPDCDNVFLTVQAAVPTPGNGLWSWPFTAATGDQSPRIAGILSTNQVTVHWLSAPPPEGRILRRTEGAAVVPEQLVDPPQANVSGITNPPYSPFEPGLVVAQILLPIQVRSDPATVLTCYRGSMSPATQIN